MFPRCSHSKVSRATILSFVVDEIKMKMECTGCTVLLAAHNNSRSVPKMSSPLEKAGGKQK